MVSFRKDIVACLLLFLLSMFIFTRGLSIHGLEYRDDEIFYFKSTQEMVQSGNVLSPTYFGENRFQKPILYYWLVLFSYKVFGINWFAARFVAVFFAGLSVGLTWLMGKTLFNQRVGTLSAVILMTIPLFFRHAKNAVPDMVLNFFIICALYCAIRFTQSFSDNSQKNSSSTIFSILFFVACALGFMVKGFIALIVPILTVVLYGVFTQKTKILTEMRFGRGAFIIFLIVCPWFIYMILTHGATYLNYMLVDETKNRLISAGTGNILLSIAATFFDHSVFYLGVIGSYFSPWSIFLIGAIPLAFFKIRSKDSTGEGLSLLLIWFFVVFCFFSMIYFSINHYMLVLAVPFAILVSYFFLEPFDCRQMGGRVIVFLRKYGSILIFTAVSLVFSFVFVFLAGAQKWWLFVFFVAYGFAVRAMHKSRKPLTAPLSLGVLILFVLAQSSLIEKAGITSHATLAKFAATITAEMTNHTNEEMMIGVGSHDIHEKEFQVYFNQRVIKAAGSVEQETRDKLTRLFKTDKKVYCLITEKDFEHFLESSFPGNFEIVQEDYVFRRRMYIDKGFFIALLKLDQATAHRYLKEKIVLITKEGNA